MSKSRVSRCAAAKIAIQTRKRATGRKASKRSTSRRITTRHDPVRRR